MKYSILIVLLLFVGCNSVDDKSVIYDTFHMNLTPTDTIHFNDIREVYDTRNERYFLISYVTQKKGDADNIEGDIWFNCSNGFPSKNQIDSLIYDVLPFNKNCYQGIVIKYIYEFKDFSDYIGFDMNYTGNTKSIKTHKSCQ